MIFPESASHMTALQRVSLNGNYQDARILPVLTSGAATAVWNGFRRIDAACIIRRSLVLQAGDPYAAASRRASWGDALADYIRLP